MPGFGWKEGKTLKLKGGTSEEAKERAMDGWGQGSHIYREP
jgi:hypothetical protein